MTDEHEKWRKCVAAMLNAPPVEALEILGRFITQLGSEDRDFFTKELAAVEKVNEDLGNELAAALECCKVVVDREDNPYTSKYDASDAVVLARKALERVGQAPRVKELEEELALIDKVNEDLVNELAATKTRSEQSEAEIEVLEEALRIVAYDLHGQHTVRSEARIKLVKAEARAAQASKRGSGS